jgi:HK97 gp10 family phage protein
MARVNVEIDDIRELIKDLKKMADKGKSALDAAALAGAEYAKPRIQQAIKLGTEDDIHLRDNIKVKKSRRKHRFKSSAFVEVGKKSVDYGFHLETGTSKTKAQPFMRDTVDKNAEQIAEEMGKTWVEKVGL